VNSPGLPRFTGRASAAWSIIAIIPVTRSSTDQKERDWLPVPYKVIRLFLTTPSDPRSGVSAPR
jgi:hypothetical protein